MPSFNPEFCKKMRCRKLSNALIDGKWETRCLTICASDLCGTYKTCAVCKKNWNTGWCIYSLERLMQ